MQDTSQKISHTYDSALEFAKSHYENFPVVSLLIPKDLQKHVAIIYWFARTADDIADEGILDSKERLAKLNEFEEHLTYLLNGQFNLPYAQALYNTIIQKELSPQHFYNLLTAFKQDVVKNRYLDFSEVLNYCKHSANPVGRLILELFGIRNQQAFEYSDKICTALQLTNFYQDTEIDYEKGRIYFPQNEMSQFNVSENIFANKENNANLKKLLKYNIDRTQALFDEGKNLLKFLSGRLKYEIKWTILGGEMILNKIRKNDYNIFNSRPSLKKSDFSALFLKSFFS
ncbi:MAG: squalene synthase HpnC [Ignavibacteriaceae bacterium]|nr:squalene synthase HpnC [Ignavibacteriaceae bacterium]